MSGGRGLLRRLRRRLTPGLLDRWLVLRFAKAYVTFAASAATVFLVIDLFTNLDGLHGAQEGFGAAVVARYGSMLPELFFTISPFLTLVSALWVIATLQRANELTPLLAAGFSPRRIAWPLLLVGASLAPVAWADREYVLPAVGDLRRRARGFADERWERPRPIPDGEGGVLAARFYETRTGALREVRFTRFDEAGGEGLTIIAERGVHVPYAPGQAGGWALSDGVVIERVPGPDGKRDAIAPIGSEGLFLESRVVRADVEAAIESPMYLSASELRAQLRRTPGFRHLEVQIYERVTYPLAGVVLLLLGVPIAIRSQGGVDTFVRFLVCLAASFGYFVCSTLSFELGARDVLPPVVAAFGPVLAFGAVGVGLTFFYTSRRR